MDFHLDTLLNLPNIVAESYSSTSDAIVVKLQLVNAGILKKRMRSGRVPRPWKRTKQKLGVS
jgi:hypothetical protein